MTVGSESEEFAEVDEAEEGERFFFRRERTEARKMKKIEINKIKKKNLRFGH